MGNQTNSKRWGARERLTFIENLAYWRGWIRRSDICARFGVSVPQASSDLTEYQRLYPANLAYDKSRKCYVANLEMEPALVPVKFENALTVLQGSADAGCDVVASIDLPQHYVPFPQAKEMVRAVLSGSAIEIYYYSVNSGTEKWRTVAPHAFAHDGYRWHARAWCFESKAHRDFVMGRIDKVRATTVDFGKIPVDQEWNRWVSLKFSAHPSLRGAQRTAVERDFGMKGGIGSLKVRQAMLHYTLVYLGLHPKEGKSPRLVLVGSGHE